MRASGFYLTILGVILISAAIAGAVFGALYIFDLGYVPHGYTYAAIAAAVAAGVLLCLPGLTLIWMADVVKDLGGLRDDIAAQTRASNAVAIALEDLLLETADRAANRNGRGNGRVNGHAHEDPYDEPDRGQRWRPGADNDFDRI